MEDTKRQQELWLGMTRQELCDHGHMIGRKMLTGVLKKQDAHKVLTELDFTDLYLWYPRVFMMYRLHWFLVYSHIWSIIIHGSPLNSWRTKWNKKLEWPRIKREVLFSDYFKLGPQLYPVLGLQPKYLLFLVPNCWLTLQITRLDHYMDQFLMISLCMCAHRYIIGSVSLENSWHSHVLTHCVLIPPHCPLQNLLAASSIMSIPCLTEM